MAPFALCFIGQSFPIPYEVFTCTSPTQYVLDVVTTVTSQVSDLKEVALFLTSPGVLDPSMGLGLYIKAGSGDWQYRGCVHTGHPSEAMPLCWGPDVSKMCPTAPGTALIGALRLPLQPTTAHCAEPDECIVAMCEDLAVRGRDKEQFTLESGASLTDRYMGAHGRRGGL